MCLFVLFNSCIEHSNRRFTKKQVQSLGLSQISTIPTNQKSVVNVDLNPFLGENRFDLQPYVDEIKIICLETTHASLVGDVSHIEVTASRIYIMDRFKGNGLIIFDRNGKFIKRLPHGNGPGELSRLYDFSFDSQNDQLVIYQHPYLVTLTKDGEYVKQKRVPLGFFNFKCIPNGYVLKTLNSNGNAHLGKWKDNTLLVTDRNFKISLAGFSHLPFETKYGGHSYLSRNGNHINVTDSYMDTIYQYDIKSKQLLASYSLDYHTRKLPQKYVFEKSSKKFNQAINNNDYNMFLGEYLETNTHNLFRLRNHYSGHSTLVYRDKQSGKLLGGQFALYDANEVPPIAFPTSSYKDYFISVHNPSENDKLLKNSSIISDCDKKKILLSKSDDNPMVVFFKLKSF